MSLPTIDRTFFAPYRQVNETEQVFLHQKFKFNASKLDDTEPQNAFIKDWDRLKNELCYDGQSIDRRYRDEWNQLEAIEKIKKILPQDLDIQEENLDKGYEVSKTELRERVTHDFNQYLERSLGPQRANLKTEILWRFSQKAITQILAIGQARMQKKFNGTFPPRLGAELEGTSIELKIPENPKHPVQIIAKVQSTYDRFIRKGAQEALDIPPIHFVGKVTYTIGFRKGWIWRSKRVGESRAQAEIKYFRPLRNKAAGDA